MNAARKMAGQIRYPSSNTTAKAKPVGGQIGVALGWTEASAKLNFATARYVIVMPENSMRSAMS
jgi:hypothetical protein